MAGGIKHQQRATGGAKVPATMQKQGAELVALKQELYAPMRQHESKAAFVAQR
jgi:hypothetical protein